MKLSGSMLKLFDYDIGQPTINRLKQRAAELYQADTRRSRRRYCMESLYMLMKLT